MEFPLKWTILAKGVSYCETARICLIDIREWCTGDEIKFNPEHVGKVIGQLMAIVRDHIGNDAVKTWSISEI